MNFSHKLRNKPLAWLAPILILYLVLAGLYATFTPAWQAPDEPAHYNFVRYIAEQGRLPVLREGDYPHDYLEQIKTARFPDDMSIDPIRYEAWQPPLYYLLAAPVYRLVGGDLTGLRLFSVVLGAGVVLAAYGLGRRLRPDQAWLAPATAAFVAFVPMHVAVTASVSNDPLAELLLALIVMQLLGWKAGTGPSRKAAALTGLVLGLGLLTKLTLYYTAIPLVLAALVLSERNWARLAGRAGLVFGIAGIMVLPWIGRNLAVYGWPDLLGMRNHERVVAGQLRSAEAIAQTGWTEHVAAFLRTTFHSFWGQFGWMAVPMDRRSYFGLGLLSGLALVGVVIAAWRGGWIGRVIGCLRTRWDGTAADGLSDLVLGLWLVLTAGGYLYYNLSFVQFQGRYLFPALIPIGLLAVKGWRTILSRPWAVVGTATCILLTLWEGMINGLDKRAVVLGLAVAGLLALRSRLRLAQDWDDLAPALPLAIMALVSAYSLFAFVLPFLS